MADLYKVVKPLPSYKEFYVSCTRRIHTIDSNYHIAVDELVGSVRLNFFGLYCLLHALLGLEMEKEHFDLRTWKEHLERKAATPEQKGNLAWRILRSLDLEDVMPPSGVDSGSTRPRNL